MLEGDEGDGHGYQEGFPKATSPGVRSIFPRSGKASWRGSHQPQDVLRRQHSREKKREAKRDFLAVSLGLGHSSAVLTVYTGFGF